MSNKGELMKVKLSELVTKITYSDDSNEEILKSVVQNTKSNKELNLIKSKKSYKPLSDKKIEGILRRDSNRKAK